MSFNHADSIGLHIAEVLRLKRSFVDGHMKKLGLNRTQWRTLAWIDILSPCTQKALIKKMEIDPGQLTRLLDKFEKEGAIQRTPLEHDRRCLFIEITPQGNDQYIKKINQVFADENKILMKGFSKQEEEQLKENLKKLQINLLEEL